MILTQAEKVLLVGNVIYTDEKVGYMRGQTMNVSKHNFDLRWKSEPGCSVEGK